MLKDLNFIRYWGVLFLNIKYTTSINNHKSNVFKTKINSTNNDLLGMPNLFFKLIYKPYNLNFFDPIKNNSYHLFFFLQFFILFNLSALESKISKNNFNCELNYNNVLIFYSNFNIFSMIFLFKNNSFLTFNYNKFNSIYCNDFLILRGFSLINLKN